VADGGARVGTGAAAGLDDSYEAWVEVITNRVRLQFLGSGDAFGSGGRFQTCLHLSGPSEPILIDCGASSLIALKRAGLDPPEIGHVLLTHLHGDHFGGLPFLILDGQFSRRSRPLLVGGPPGVRERVEAAMEVFFPGSSQSRPPLRRRVCRASGEHADPRRACGRHPVRRQAR
jgi:ribonuclease BN (tRNA processing enzyme)